MKYKMRTTMLYIFMMFWVGQKVHSGFSIILQKILKKIFFVNPILLLSLGKAFDIEKNAHIFSFLNHKYNILPQRGKNEKERDEAPTVLLAP